MPITAGKATNQRPDKLAKQLAICGGVFACLQSKYDLPIATKNAVAAATHAARSKGGTKVGSKLTDTCEILPVIGSKLA